jgi:MFS family permease
MKAFKQYVAVWRVPGAPVLLVVGTFARVGIGMISLSLLMLVHAITGSYATAAIASVSYAIAGAALGPVWGRLADRFGPTRILLISGVAHPVALAILLALQSMPVSFVYAAAALAGATYPPLTAAIRGAWTSLTRTRLNVRTAALAAETSMFELVFVVGPLLVAFFVALASPAAALAFSALATLVGTLWTALSPAIRAQRPHPVPESATFLGPLRAPGFAALLACCAGLGAAFGASTVAIPAYATALGGSHPETLAGVLIAVWSLGSAFGGLWFGTRVIRHTLSRQFAWLLAGVAVSLLILPIMPGPVSLGIALMLGGATIAPALTIENALVGRLAPGQMMNEAYTWIVTIGVSASAFGSATSGLIVDGTGAGAAFLFAGLCAAFAAAVAALPSGAIARADAASATA